MYLRDFLAHFPRCYTVRAARAAAPSSRGPEVLFALVPSPLPGGSVWGVLFSSGAIYDPSPPEVVRPGLSGKENPDLCCVS